MKSPVTIEIPSWSFLTQFSTSSVAFAKYWPCVCIRLLVTHANNEIDISRLRGGARHFHLGGPLEGPVLQQGELSMVCVGLSARDLKNFGGHWGGPGKILGGQCPPPISAPVKTRLQPQHVSVNIFQIKSTSAINS